MNVIILRHKENFDMQITDKEKKIIKRLEVANVPEKVKNPRSGVEVELCPEAVALYDLIVGCSICLEQGRGDDEMMQRWETARIVFRRNWPDHYMKLID